MEATVERDLTITVKGLTLHEAQQLRDGLQRLRLAEGYRMKGERLTVNYRMIEEISKAQWECAKMV